MNNFYKHTSQRGLTSLTLKLRLYKVLIGLTQIFDGLITILTFATYGSRLSENIYWTVVSKELEEMDKKIKIN